MGEETDLYYYILGSIVGSIVCLGGRTLDGVSVGVSEGTLVEVIVPKGLVDLGTGTLVDPIVDDCTCSLVGVCANIEFPADSRTTPGTSLTKTVLPLASLTLSRALFIMGLVVVVPSAL